MNLSLAPVFPYGDPRRNFSQGTPTEVFKLMKETWEPCAPTPERAEEDILNWPQVCVKYSKLKWLWCQTSTFDPGGVSLELMAREQPMVARKRDRISKLPWNIFSHPGL